MSDPDTEVRICLDMKMAEALTFRNDYMVILRNILRAWEYYPKLKKSLTAF